MRRPLGKVAVACTPGPLQSDRRATQLSDFREWTFPAPEHRYSDRVLQVPPDGPRITAPAVPSTVPAAGNPYVAYLESLKSAESRRAMRGCLDRIAALAGHDTGHTFPWAQLRYSHTAAIRTRLSEQKRLDGDELVPWAPAYVDKHLAALRGVLAAAWKLGLMAVEDYQRARDIPTTGGTRLPPGRSIAAAEVAAMLGTALDGTLIGERNAAIVAVFLATGLRCAELAGARREHYDPGGRALRIVGKRDKEREVYLSEDAAAYLGVWLSRTGLRRGPLFCPVDRWGKPALRHLSTRGARAVITGLRRKAGLPHLTPHDFRRTFIGDLLSGGVDLATVQAMVGHASPVTTARYDRRPAEQRREAANLVRLPRPSPSR